MEETNFVGICEPKSEQSEVISGDITDLENDPLKDTDKREENKRKRNRSKQPKTGSQRRQGKAMRSRSICFKCPQCDEKFPTNDQLKLHEFIVHEGKDPFLCYVCKKKFILKEDLTKHMGESHRRFKCAKCNDSTDSSYYDR